MATGGASAPALGAPSAAAEGAASRGAAGCQTFALTRSTGCRERAGGPRRTSGNGPLQLGVPPQRDMHGGAAAPAVDMAAVARARREGQGTPESAPRRIGSKARTALVYRVGEMNIRGAARWEDAVVLALNAKHEEMMGYATGEVCVCRDTGRV
eukprot:355797-Chlamydomonas_euryale.AAC.8